MICHTFMIPTYPCGAGKLKIFREQFKIVKKILMVALTTIVIYNILQE